MRYTLPVIMIWLLITGQQALAQWEERDLSAFLSVTENNELATIKRYERVSNVFIFNISYKALADSSVEAFSDFSLDVAEMFDSGYQNITINAAQVLSRKKLCLVLAFKKKQESEIVIGFYILKNTGEQEKVHEFKYPKGTRETDGFLHFMNGEMGFYMGEIDLSDYCIPIYTTHNGGESWEKVSCDKGFKRYRDLEIPKFAGVHTFYTEERIFPYFRMPNSVTHDFREYGYLDLTEHMHPEGMVLKWSDWGNKWDILNIKHILPDESWIISGFAALDSQIWVIKAVNIKYDYRFHPANNQNKLYITQDAGKNWRQINLDSLSLHIVKNIRFLPPSDACNEPAIFVLEGYARFYGGNINADSVFSYVSLDTLQNWNAFEKFQTQKGQFHYTSRINYINREWGAFMTRAILYVEEHPLYKQYYFNHKTAIANTLPRIKDTLRLCPGEPVNYQFSLPYCFYWSNFADGRDTITESNLLNFKLSDSTRCIFLHSNYHVDTLFVERREIFPSDIIKSEYDLCPNLELNIDLPEVDNQTYLLNGSQIKNISIDKPGRHALQIEPGYYCDTTIDFTLSYHPDYSFQLDTVYCLDESQTGYLDLSSELSSLTFIEPNTINGSTVFHSPSKTSLIATDTNGCNISIDLELINSCPLEVYVPNVFNPKSAIAENALFKPYVRFADSYVITIYNRWGQVVFEGSHLDEGWDGQFQGAPAPEGVYVYSLQVESLRPDQTIQRTNLNGNVVLMR